MSLVISKVFTYDTDAGNYIQAVEAADGQALEAATRQAINNFVVGCKQDGIWSAIKASCILAGARTLNGALVPLAGTAPTNNGPFVAGDYNRKTGLGDASNTTKYIDTNRAENADPLNSIHVSAYVSDPFGSGQFLVHGADGSNATGFYRGNTVISNSRNGTPISTANLTTLGFVGVSRSASNSTSFRVLGSIGTSTVASNSANSANFNLFRSPTYASAYYGKGRLAFYSIGESLDLAKLDARVTDLINAFGAAIP